MMVLKNYANGGGPFPKVQDILIQTKKQLHGWWRGKRECTAERMLINPYNGCSIGCWFCYTRALPGYFQEFRRNGTIFIAQDFDKIVAQQLDSINVATCGYLSPVTDPFQPINQKYKLSEKIIRGFVEHNLPIEFITKAKVPPEIYSMLKQQKHSFGQVSILTCDEKLHNQLVPCGAPINELFNNLENLSKNNIYSVCRIDPIFPYITDDEKHLKEIVLRAKNCGATHIIASVLDIPVRLRHEIFLTIGKIFGEEMKYKYSNLYAEHIGYLNAKIDYRERIFNFLRQVCDENGLTFALCMEYEMSTTHFNKGEQGGFVRGLNSQFMSSINCEGINIPVYIRNGKQFYPATDCFGNCLNCAEARCSIEDLAMGKPDSKKDWQLKDYRRWSLMINDG